MILSISAILIMFLSSYVIYYTYKRRNQLTCMVGMMISMTNSMMASIAIGSIVGAFIESKDLMIPTIVSVSIGMMIGYVTGRPVSLMSSLDGLTAGIMGGMMGSMLGVMLQPKSVDLMILFIDMIFVLVIFLLVRLIDAETKSAKQENALRKPLMSNPIAMVGIIAILGIMVLGKGTIFNGDPKPVEATSATPVSTNIHQVRVTPSGYTPNNIVIDSGMEAILNFTTEKGTGCLRKIVSEELGLNATIQEGTDNYINLKSLQPGTYEYACGMNMYKGTITVMIKS